MFVLCRRDHRAHKILNMEVSESVKEATEVARLYYESDSAIAFYKQVNLSGHDYEWIEFQRRPSRRGRHPLPNQRFLTSSSSAVPAPLTSPILDHKCIPFPRFPVCVPLCLGQFSSHVAKGLFHHTWLLIGLAVPRRGTSEMSGSCRSYPSPRVGDRDIPFGVLEPEPLAPSHEMITVS